MNGGWNELELVGFPRPKAGSFKGRAVLVAVGKQRPAGGPQLTNEVLCLDS